MTRINLEILSKDKFIIEEKELTRVLSYIKRLENKIDKVISYIEEDQNKELSVDSYFRFKDLCEFDDILNILKGIDK